VPPLEKVNLAQVDDLVAITAIAFGQVHSRICVTNELSGRVDAPTGESYADAGGDIHLVGRERVGRSERFTYAAGHQRQVRFSVQVLAQDDKFVTRHSRQAVVGPEQCAEPAGDGHQELIADVVTVAVVHKLELIEIHEENPERLFRPPTALDCVLQAIE
jgi:hypothetical protein